MTKYLEELGVKEDAVVDSRLYSEEKDEERSKRFEEQRKEYIENIHLGKRDFRFYEYVLNQRHKAQLPPYVYLLKLSLTYKTESIAVKNIKQLKNKINAIIRNNDSYINTIVSQPAPAFHEHSSQGYTWQIIIKAKSRQNLTALLSQLPPNPHLHFQLDPPTLL